MVKTTLIECLEAHEQLNAFGNLIHERLRVHEYLQQVQEGNTAFEQDTLNRGVIFLLEGKLDLVVTKPDFVEAHYKTIKPGQLVVEMSLDPEATVPYAARALQPALLVWIPRRAVLSIIDALVEPRDAYFAHLAEYHARVLKEVRKKKETTLEFRVLQFLLAQPTPTEDKPIELPAREQGYRALFGAPGEAVDAVLQKLAKAGTLKLKGRLIPHLDSEALKGETAKKKAGAKAD